MDIRRFFTEVRNEASKVTWPTRRETIMSTIMVFIFVLIAALFLFSADQIISALVQWILGIGS